MKAHMGSVLVCTATIMWVRLLLCIQFKRMQVILFVSSEGYAAWTCKYCFVGWFAPMQLLHPQEVKQD